MKLIGDDMKQEVVILSRNYPEQILSQNNCSVIQIRTQYVSDTSVTYLVKFQEVF
jgi:hypothetical protein